ncbi:MAG: hypothetical protein V8T87_05625, partial [Victivallales bacterium]
MSRIFHLRLASLEDAHIRIIHSNRATHRDICHCNPGRHAPAGTEPGKRISEKNRMPEQSEQHQLNQQQDI